MPGVEPLGTELTCRDFSQGALPLRMVANRFDVWATSGPRNLVSRDNERQNLRSAGQVASDPSSARDGIWPQATRHDRTVLVGVMQRRRLSGAIRAR